MTEVAEKFSTAVAHFRSGRHAQAEQICRKILAAQPEFADAWNLLGMIAHHGNHFDLAAECMQRFLDLAPNSPVLEGGGMGPGYGRRQQHPLGWAEYA